MINRFLLIRSLNKVGCRNNMKKSSGITGIKYINLDANRLRHFLLKITLFKAPFDQQRIPGVVYSSNEKLYDRYLENGVDKYIEPRKNGVIGCWIAHTNALKSIQERKGVSIILEDDFVCHPSFFLSAWKMINSFSKDFDIIFFDLLGSGPLKEHRIYKNIYDNNGHSYPPYHGSHCLFVNNVKIDKLIDININSKIMDIDGHYLSNKSILSYVFYTGLSAQVYVGSEIIGSSMNPLHAVKKWRRARRLFNDHYQKTKV